MRKGSITIYMTLVLSVILSLLLTVIEGARNQAIGLQAECAFDLAVYSVFAEYNRELLEQYDLFFVDTSYGEKSPSFKRTKNHFDTYINENLSSGNTSEGLARDFLKTFLENSEITEISYASDEGGAVFERQAIAYMKQKYGISYIEDIQKELFAAQESDLTTRDITSERTRNQNIIDATEIPPKETGEYAADGTPITEEVELENPADVVNGSRAKGILRLVCADTDHISEKAVNVKEYLSQRENRASGDGLAGRDSNNLAEKLLFDAYILEKCGTYIEPKTEGGLSYQAEYILAGKDNDVDNLKWVVNRLLLMRETANVTYLFTDAAKMSEALALATSVATAAGVPILIEPIKLSLLFAWAYAESVYDVKQLLSGKRVALLKNSTNWHFSLEGMLSYEEQTAASIDDAQEQKTDSLKDGLDYKGYLYILLAIMQEKTKVFRTMDLVEMDIRKTKGNRNFRLDTCFDFLTIEVSVGSKYGYFREMKRTYYYV